uniref:TERF1-interacting nuclear factor 2 N-terminal domain-containing protein n=1 Tax=Cyprinus carpio carpio TaxID=630221 RepID=A0A9J7ZAM3_CYPCA
MTVLKTGTAALAGMSENLWLEKACAQLIPALPLWIIEYAWTKRVVEVLEGPPIWLEGDWHLLTLEEPCRIRVVAAEVWRIVQARDIKHFERVTEFLDVTYTLVPRLVTPIKHMKIMFGLQTLVIMWMLWNDQSTAKISDKIENFFPKSLPEYHKCSRRNMDLMQKNQEDFKAFAHVLARDRDIRETYIRDLMEEQYGERYAQKLEERLVHYLGELDKVLPQPTCIEQVLKQSHSYGRGEKILKKLLSRESASLATVLKRLLHCAVTANQSLDDSLSPSLSNTCEVQRDAEVLKPSNGTLRVFLRSSQNSTKENRLSQTSTKELFGSQGLWQNRNTETISPQEKICGDGVIVTSTQLSDSEIDQIDFSQSLLVGRHRQKKTQSDPEQKESETAFPEQICSRHGKKMRSILQECSEELDGEVVQAECTPTSSQSTPPLLPYTPQPQASPNQHSLSSNPDSSSTNISLSYIQQLSLSPVSSKNPVAPSPSVLQQSSASKQLAINAHGQILATVVFTEPSRADEHNLKLSLESQSFLMQSKWLQPQVCLNRLSKEECARAMDSYRACDILEREHEPEDDQYMLFDVNTLYSDSYSEDSDSTDPDYKPD